MIENDEFWNDIDTLVYEVNLDANTIEILKIFNQNKPS